jgi:prophage regulatory protein
MAGPVIRIKELCAHISLSRSTIYERMDPKSPRYSPDFPKSFSLGGAVAWYLEEVNAWLEKCKDDSVNGTLPRPPRVSPNPRTSKAQTLQTPGDLSVCAKPVLNSAQRPALMPNRPTIHSQQTRPSNLAEAIVQGGQINARLLGYLRMKTWNPAMAALLITGIEPLEGCNEIPADGIGLDGKPLLGSDDRFYKARRILKDWLYCDEDDPHLEIEPHTFLNWCLDERIDSEWLRLFLDLIGFVDKNTVDLTAARFALLTGRSN